MNRSGEALGDFEARSGARVAPADTLVVCDDVYLPVGHLRVRPSGSTGGHRGLASIGTHLGTPDYPRLRIGVGAAAGEDLADHVLSRFAASEEEAVHEALVRAGEAVETWAREGVLAAMNRFNRRVREVSP
jgi:PTH1 family peptidyl-tRNA hydrolase